MRARKRGFRKRIIFAIIIDGWSLTQIVALPTWIPAATASSCEAALSAEEMKAAAKQSPAPDTHTTPPRIEINNFGI